MTERAKFQICSFNFGFVHFMSTCFASIIVSSSDRFTTNNTSWEIASAAAARCIIFGYHLFTVLAWALNHFPRSLFWCVLGEDTDCHINISLLFLSCAHSLQFHKCSRTFFIALHIYNDYFVIIGS